MLAPLSPSPPSSLFLLSLSFVSEPGWFLNVSCLLSTSCLRSLPHRVPSQVVPSERGQQQKPWFFLQRSYWRRRSADAEHEKLLGHLLSASTAEKGIAVAISNLRKTYGGADGDKQVRRLFAPF